MRLLRNQRGDAFLFSLVLLAISGIVFMATQIVQDGAQKRLNQYKLRAQMNIVEQRIRVLLMQPQTYSGCQTGVTGITGCSLNMNYLKNIESTSIIGLPCSETREGKSGCSIKAQGWNLNLAQLEARVTLKIEGSDLIQPSTVVVQIPEELLQSQVFSCPQLDPSKPVFMGLQSGTGKAICRALTTCGSGKYMTGVNATNANSFCSNIPTATVSCGSDKFISQFKWEGTTYQSSCADRLDPFGYFGGP